ncbi:30280_t:CDS:2, partial [Racocetra persica]
QESTESNSEDSTKLNINLGALQKSASNMEDSNEYIGRVAFPQKCLIPKYEELYQLVPKYFQDDRNNMFVLTHVDFHTSNILVKNDKIKGVIDWECSEQNNKKSRENIILQKFFRSEMSHRDPDFIRTINNIDEEKKEFYSTVFSQKV